MKQNMKKQKSIIINNYEGELAYSLSSGFQSSSPKLYSPPVSSSSPNLYSPPAKIKYNSTSLEIASMAFASLVEDTFYEAWDTRFERLNKIIHHTPPEFIAKLAVFSRKEMKLRTFPLYLLVTAIKNGLHKKNHKIFKRAITSTIDRADEISEILAIYQRVNGRIRPLANILKSGIGEAFNKFNEYQFSKYKRNKSIVSLRDALYLTHPVPKSKEQSELFRKIAKNNLQVPYTWEVKLSEIPKENIKERRLFWKDIISERKLGYMAAIRNLRNILEVADKELIELISKYIKDEKIIKNSKIFPFRILTAYIMIESLLNKREENEKEILDISNVRSILNSLRSALEISIKENFLNNEFWQRDDRVLIAADFSGSMKIGLSLRSKITLKDIALFYGLISRKYLKNSHFGVFGEEWKILDDILEGEDDIFSAYEKALSIDVGKTTNGHLALKWLEENRIDVDRVMFFTDCILWNSVEGDTVAKTFYDYKNNHPKTKIYLFDLAGYGMTPIDVRENGVYFISGYSDKIFEAISYFENGSNMVKMINEYEI